MKLKDIIPELDGNIGEIEVISKLIPKLDTKNWFVNNEALGVTYYSFYHSPTVDTIKVMVLSFLHSDFKELYNHEIHISHHKGDKIVRFNEKVEASILKVLLSKNIKIGIRYEVAPTIQKPRKHTYRQY